MTVIQNNTVGEKLSCLGVRAGKDKEKSYSREAEGEGLRTTVMVDKWPSSFPTESCLSWPTIRNKFRSK